MLLRIVERLRHARSLTSIVVCTSTHPDDRILIQMAEQWGVEALAGDENDIVLRLIQAAEHCRADAVVRVTGDNPLVDPETVDRMVAEHFANGAEYTRTTGMPLGMTAEIISSKILPRLHAAVPDPHHSEYLLLYAFDPMLFRCQVLDGAPEVNRPFYSVTVDTPTDLERVRRIFTTCEAQECGPSAANVVRMLDAMPDYEGIAPTAPVKMPNGTTVTYAALLQTLAERTTMARNCESIRHKSSLEEAPVRPSLVVP